MENQDSTVKPQVTQKKSESLIQAEGRRIEAKLWLSLYFLKKFGISSLWMDAGISHT